MYNITGLYLMVGFIDYGVTLKG